MSILHNSAILISIFLTLVIFEYIWFSFVIKKFLIGQFGSLIRVIDGNISINIVAGIMAWMVIALGCFLFVVNPANSFTYAARLGAVLGFIIYATYDLTSLAFLTGYPEKFIVIDIFWGCFVCAAASSIGHLVKTLV